jgi:hypothetical protein
VKQHTTTTATTADKHLFKNMLKTSGRFRPPKSRNDA